MAFLVTVACTWLALALPVGLLLGRGMSANDARGEDAGRRNSVPDFIPDEILRSVVVEGPRRS